MVLIGLLFVASRLYPFQEASSDLWLAAKAGLIGAAFSIALAIRGRTVALDTKLLDNITDGTLRLLIGVISAGVLLLLFASGIVPNLKIGGAVAICVGISLAEFPTERAYWITQRGQLARRRACVSASAIRRPCAW